MELLYYVKDKETYNNIVGEEILRKAVVINKKIGKIELLQIMLELNNENSARILSNIDTLLKEKYDQSIMLIDDGYSAYYNKNLYPIFNLFETKLRVLLYLCNLINPEEKREKQINNIENLDFGKLFEFLFTTDSFNKESKIIINYADHRYSKKELIDKINSIEEETVWSKLVGSTMLETLQENYLEVKSYRNDVMHSRNMPTEKYNKIKKLMSIVQIKLDLLINNMFHIAPDESGKLAQFRSIGKFVNKQFDEYMSIEAIKNLEKAMGELKIVTNSEGMQKLAAIAQDLNDIVKKNN